MAQMLPSSEPALPSGQDLGPNFDSHHYLSMVIYLLSNRLVTRVSSSPHEASLSTILQMTFTFVSRRVFINLFHSRLPSIKAGWEKLLLGAQELMNEEAFRCLISVGIENEWLEIHERGHEYIFSAAKMNCSDILCDLIARGCRADSCPRSCFQDSMIVETLKNGNIDCATLLIENCDVNYEFDLDEYGSTHFAMFIMAFDDTKPDHLHCLELFLHQGANVDYKLGPESLQDFRQERFWSEAVAEWPPSILDYFYYFHRQLFPKLFMYSETPLQFSRASVLWHLDQGLDALREYLTSDPDFAKPWGGAVGNNTSKAKVRERKNHCLEVLLAEQFLLSICNPKENDWWSRVIDLSKLEIDLTWLSKTEGLASNMLFATARLVTSDPGHNKESGLRLLRWLVDQGFEVKQHALWTAVLYDQRAILECLASFCDDLEKEGAEALACAVSKNRLDTAKWLLDNGVDPNDQGNNVFERAACTSTLTMMKYLVQRGARPRTCEQGDHPSLILMDMFLYHMNMHTNMHHDSEMFNKVQYIVEEHITIDEPSCPSAQLLETCLLCPYDSMEQGRAIFEFLLRKRARLNPGSPLAVWIDAGGGHQLVQEMLDAGADPNAHSFDTIPNLCVSRTPLQAAAGIGDFILVCMLMEHDADVNRPARGDGDKTALQAICAWDPVRREERVRKDKIITLLLDRGAEVNDTNYTGHTALIYAAQLGDLSTAFSLLKHGAKLDAISTSHYYGIDENQQSALDVAAFSGRLDMVEFLLNANALSWTACSDGRDYDGAIEWARKGGNFVVSELICKHSADRKRWNVPHEQAADTETPPECTPQSLSVRTKSETASWPQAEMRAMPSEDLRDVTVLDQSNRLSYAFDDAMVERNTAAPKAKDEGIFNADATDMSWTRVIEGIEDEDPLADTRRENLSGEESDGTATRSFDTTEDSPGPGGRLYQAIEQKWVEDEQQNVDPLVSSSLSTDVFMGFSESSSL